MVRHCIFIKKPVDVYKKSPPPYGAKNPRTVLFGLSTRKPLLLLCCLSLGQENQCFYLVVLAQAKKTSVFAALFELRPRKPLLLLCLLSLGQENQCFYCVFGTTSEIAPRKPLVLCVFFQLAPRKPLFLLCFVELASRKPMFLLCLLSLHQENHCFYCLV